MTALAYFAPQIFTVLVGDNESQALLITGLFGAEKVSSNRRKCKMSDTHSDSSILFLVHYVRTLYHPRQ